MGATWYRGDPSLRHSAQAASAWGTSGAAPGIRGCALSCLGAGNCATALVLEVTTARWAAPRMHAGGDQACLARRAVQLLTPASKHAGEPG